MLRAKENCKMLVFEPENIFLQLEEGYKIALSKLGRGSNDWKSVCSDIETDQVRIHPECDLFAMFPNELKLYYQNIQH